jgi:hypothetical protein
MRVDGWRNRERARQGIQGILPRDLLLIGLLPDRTLYLPLYLPPPLTGRWRVFDLHRASTAAGTAGRCVHPAQGRLLSRRHLSSARLANILRLRSRLLRRCRGSILGIDPPPGNHPPHARPVVDTDCRLIGSSHFACKAWQGMRRPCGEHERQKNPGGCRCGEASIRFHGLLPLYMYVD